MFFKCHVREFNDFSQVILRNVLKHRSNIASHVYTRLTCNFTVSTNHNIRIFDTDLKIIRKKVTLVWKIESI